MELKIFNANNSETGKITLPPQFSEEIRPDLIKKAVLAIQSHGRQPYGSDPQAGMKSSAKISRRRRDYRGSYGFGISRVPRKILSRRGTRMNWVGAFAPGTVGGRKAHPPKADKIWAVKINVSERRKAIRSAMSATLLKKVVEARGHKIPSSYPFALDSDFESLSKTKAVVLALTTLGFDKELVRARVKTIRAGIGKRRGRRYKTKKSVLFVVSKKCALLNAAKNIPGIDVITVDSLNAELLAPGTDIGRATLFTKGAIELIGKNNLFTKSELKYKTEVSEVKVKKTIKVVKAKKPVKEVKKPVVKKTTTKKASKKE